MNTNKESVAFDGNTGANGAAGTAIQSILEQT